MRRILLLSLAVPLGLLMAQTKAPRFEDYPATEAYKGMSAPLVLTKDDRAYRTRLRWAAAEKPNFAGHYILTSWGCGALCLTGAVIDAHTGKVYWFPHTLCCWSGGIDRPIQYRLNSRLVAFSGARNEKEGDEGTHYYEFKDGKFVHLKSVMKEKP